ncbi:MAG: Ezrin/radixin/moesin family protein [Cytophagales bacterium]|nr:Ezrin/radixin/moesin family protein [Cytophagales bacterium]
MKKNFIVTLLIVFVCTATGAFAQKKTKEEKAQEKQWKKKLKDLDPLQYKALLEERDGLKTELTDLNSKVVSLEADLNAKNADNEKLLAQLKGAEQKLVEEQKSNVTKGGGRVGANGVVFKVQIGAFRNKDLTKYFDNNPNFSGDVDADGTKKYSLGYFGDYWEADTFKKYLREMGVKDAWLVAYKNGQRVEMKDVLEGIASAK